jgi:hypothetical protein
MEPSFATQQMLLLILVVVVVVVVITHQIRSDSSSSASSSSQGAMVERKKKGKGRRNGIRNQDRSVLTSLAFPNHNHLLKNKKKGEEKGTNNRREFLSWVRIEPTIFSLVKQIDTHLIAKTALTVGYFHL